jgi:hypothetical protein
VSIEDTEQVIVDQVAAIIAADYQNRAKGIEWGPYPAANAIDRAGLLATPRAMQWRRDSVVLNSILWALADMLGDIPEGAVEWDAPADPTTLVDRVRTRLLTDERKS